MAWRQPIWAATDGPILSLRDPTPPTLWCSELCVSVLEMGFALRPTCKTKLPRRINPATITQPASLS